MSLFNDYVKAGLCQVKRNKRIDWHCQRIIKRHGFISKIWLEDGGADDWSNKDDDVRCYR